MQRLVERYRKNTCVQRTPAHHWVGEKDRDRRMANALVRIEFERLNHVLYCLGRVNKSLRDCAWGQKLVPLAELLVEHTVREPLSHNPNSLKNTAASKLIQNELGRDDSRFLEMIRLDAPYKVRGGVVECVHELLELGDIEPSYCPEGSTLPGRMGHRCRCRPQGLHERVGRFLQKSHHVVVQRVPILEEPSVDRVAAVSGTTRSAYEGG